jgi:GAF domain-containing protein
LRTLVDAGAVLSHSLDYEQTFDALVQLMVRTIATICTIDTFEEREDGVKRIARVAAAHVDPRWNLMEFSQRYAARFDEEPHPVAQALFEGHSALIQVDDELLESFARSPEHLAFIRALEVRSLITVPLVAGGKILGALTCALGREDVPRTNVPERYDAEDLFFIEELGRRAGTAIDNARSYERTRHIALVLQSASLPQRLPSFDFLKLDADYRPSGNDVTIGGDWYDAFALEDGRVVLTVGDVIGHGLEAAIVMTKLRQAMQSAAIAIPDPNVMLDVADKTLRLHDGESFATAIAAIFDPKENVTTFASAGHPGPALRTPDGDIVEFTSPGMMLGLRGGKDRETCAVPTPPGSVLVFFTDGLIEATRDIDEGYRTFHAALRRDGVAFGASPARALVEAVLDGRSARDDIAVLVATTVNAAEKPLPRAPDAS